jgi:Flp pilus assembly pilin Flp
MEGMRKVFTRFMKDEGGQAIVEYILTLVIAVGVVGSMTAILRKSLFGIWQLFSKEITAACPGCPANPSIRLR